MSCSTYLLGQVHKEHSTADLIKLSIIPELLGYGQEVKGSMLLHQGAHRIEYDPMLLTVEACRRKLAHCVIDAVRLNQKCSEDSLFDIKSLRRSVSHLKP